MARNNITIPKFGRVVYSLEGKGELSQPKKATNFFLGAGKLTFRRGYNAVQAAPGGAFSAPGFAFVTNSSGTSEFLGVENHASTINAYTYDKTTLVRTVIDSTTIAGTDWVITSYKDNAYFINPGGTKTVYRHVIGDNSSLVPIEDSNYVSTTAPAFTVNMLPNTNVRSWPNTDTWVFTGANTYTLGSINKTFNADGSMLLNGPSEDHAASGGELLLESTFTAGTQDLSGFDYLYINLTGQTYLNYFTSTSTLPQLKIGGSWVNVTDAKFVKSDSGTKKATWELYVNGLTLTAVQGIRIPVPLKPNRNNPAGPQQDFLTVQPIYQGGTYLESSNTSHRLWDTTKDGDGVRYGSRFFNGVATYSSITEVSITKAQALGYTADTFSDAMGGKPSLEANAPSGSYSQVQFIRYDAINAKWKVLSTVTTAPWTYVDKTVETAVPALTDAVSVGASTQLPAFSTAGVCGAFPFKQFMIWLINTGVSNIQMSRVGNAEEMYTTAITYDATDLTQPSQRTLADGADDIPIAGCQMGNVAFICGSKGAYVMDGNFPVQMTPTRLIAGSRGIIGRYALVRYRISEGQYAAAYCDPSFNIWLVEATPQFAGDGRGQPQEISLAVRGLVKSFLYDEQLVLNSSLDKTEMQLEFDEEDGALWCILGHRAAVYRQDMGENGWEFYDYSLRSSASYVDTWTGYFADGAVATSVAPGDVAWSSLGNPLTSDDAYAQTATFSLGVGKTSETLRIAGYKPSSLIPASASIQALKWEVERSKTGDLAITETKVQPRDNGADQGSNLSTSTVLTTTDVNTEFSQSVLPSVADINAGYMGIDLKYTQEDSNVDWNDPTKWTITVSGGGTTASMLVSALYTGAGTKPSGVYVNVSSSATAGGTPSGGGIASTEPDMLGVTDDGIGETLTAHFTPAATVTSSGTHRIYIPLTAGSGNTTITRIASATLVSGVNWVGFSTFTGSAAFSAYTLGTVKVDNVRLTIQYRVTSPAASFVGWSQVCFTPDGRRVAIRSTGEIDILEKDFRTGNYITGINRDGGYTPPDAEWQSQNMNFNGMKAMVSGVQANTTGTTENPSFYSMIPDGSWIPAFQSGYSSSRWWRFPLSQTAIRTNIKLTLPETSGGIEALTFEVQQQSRSKPI